jgi:hypothetical protein
MIIPNPEPRRQNSKKFLFEGQKTDSHLEELCLQIRPQADYLSGSAPNKRWLCRLIMYYSVLRIRDVYPGSRILIFTHPGSRIPDPKAATKERGEKNCCHTFFCSHKFHKIENYLFLKCLSKKFGPIFKEL